MTKTLRAARTSNISRRRENARVEGGTDYVTRRKEIVAIAASLFKENGLKATTLADVGERANLDRATLYYYVSSKQELFQLCIEGSLDENLARAEALLRDARLSPREKVTDLIRTLMISYDVNYPQLYVYIQEQMTQIGNDDSKWAKDIQRKTRRFEAIMLEMVTTGIEAGGLRADVDARVAVKALFGMLNWTHRWYRPGSGTSPEAIADMFNRIFFEGMARATKATRARR